jgi:hypothetical protein
VKLKHRELNAERPQRGNQHRCLERLPEVLPASHTTTPNMASPVEEKLSRICLEIVLSANLQGAGNGNRTCNAEIAAPFLSTDFIHG